MPKFQDLAGQRFGLWTVISRVPRTKRGGASRWLCRCDCGNEKVVDSATMKAGHSRSCGCKSVEWSASARKTHGLSGTRIHRIWKNMRKRCLSVNAPRYSDYGGRGITICPEWSDFQVFYQWAMANGYTDDLTIERIDVDGNYEPSNCTWIPGAEQSRNRRITFRDADGVPWYLKARGNGINDINFNQRLRYGMPPEIAATRPIGRWV
jgi:hypothetical protein